jgi:hypothetical protein
VVFSPSPVFAAPDVSAGTVKRMDPCLYAPDYLEKLATILDSGEFEGMEAHYSSAAQVHLTGTIKDNATRDAHYEINLW